MTKKCHRRNIKTGTLAFISHDILANPRIVTLSTRMKLSVTEKAAFNTGNY